MTTHICRDFLSWANVAQPNHALYLPAIFLRRVLNFTQIGHTNFNLDSSTFLKGSGVAGAINIGSTQERYFQVSSGVYTVSASDVNRILVIQSTNNSLTNSGLFRITAFDSVTNSFIVNNRSPDLPIAESGLTWSVYEREDLATAGFLNGANANASNQYHGNGSATTSRIILQSPHSSSWQVRICYETVSDQASHIGAAGSFACGFGGNASGDFSVGGRHTHIPLWFNATAAAPVIVDTSYTCVGVYDTITPLTIRFYAWGDPSTGSMSFIFRQHGSVNSQAVVSFGIPEDEDSPVPTDALYRLFSFGSNGTLTNINKIRPGYNDVEAQSGVAFGYSGQPIICVPTTYVLMPSTARSGNSFANSNASDSSFNGMTELHGFDLIGGTFDQVASAVNPPVFTLEARRLGRMPFFRKGRENYATYSTSTDSARSFLHIEQGVYAPWSGSILP